MSWDRSFDDPVVAPDGRPLRTLRDAAKYIQKLPNAKLNETAWQTAMECLIAAAEGRGPMLHARAGMLQAMQGRSGTAYDPDRARTPTKKWRRAR